MSGCDVLISYKREERARVEVLAQRLQAAGLRVWFDAKLEAGGVFDAQIADELKRARAVLVCWTPGAIASEWVRAEAAMAQSGGKLIAVFLEPTELIPPFNLVHAEDLSAWRGEDDHTGWVKVLTRAAALSDNAELNRWAEMMRTGDASRLRQWVDSATPSPLRSAARYWLSESNASPIAAPVPRKRGAGLWPWALGAGGIAAAVALGLMLTRPAPPSESAAESFEEAVAEAAPAPVEEPPAPVLPPRAETGVISNAAECDSLDFRIQPAFVGEDRVMIVLEAGSGITWWKAVHVPLAGGGEAQLSMQDGSSDERTFLLSELDLGRAMGFSKAKLFGAHVRLDYSWGSVSSLRGGDRLTLTWRRDSC